MKRKAMERVVACILFACALISVLAVVTMTAYMGILGTPAIFEVGWKEILFGTVWNPSGTDPQFGIFYVILSSLFGTMISILLGGPLGLLCAIYLSEVASGEWRKRLKSVVELLAGIPSVIYGLMGMMVICPAVYQIECFVFKNDSSHQFTGGANFLSAILVLTLMILPTLITMTETALASVPTNYRMASQALGATKIQTIFKVVVPSAKRGILSAIVLGVGRAIGETMAVISVAGNSIHFPAPFYSVRFLTTAIASEMAYSEGLHRQVLFTIGLVLFIFILLVNIGLHLMMKKDG